MNLVDTYVIVDAGPVGLGAIIAQEQVDKSIRPVAYASRSLSKTEQRYSQTEKEALAVVWACEKFHLYLYGKKFTILSDHKPLEVIYSPKGKPSPRILRWGLRLQSYNFTIKHISGVDNPADILSRQPLNTTNQRAMEETEQFINVVIANATPKAITFSDLLTESSKDTILIKVATCIESNRWPKDASLKPYFNIREELPYKSCIVVRDSQIVIPKSLQMRIIKLAHESHQGITKTKSLLREKVWWPGINNDIENEIKTCIPCLSVSKQSAPEPNAKCQIHGKLYTLICMDLCHLEKAFLVL